MLSQVFLIIVKHAIRTNLVFLATFHKGSISQGKHVFQIVVQPPTIRTIMSAQLESVKPASTIASPVHLQPPAKLAKQAFTIMLMLLAN